ncbi:SpoIIE family protein phosphatase [Nonomuraea sp. LPB2021202275-12-8]|uniref:SpoIIE family protein phosphatase n=1 Tax=Nonomuraea sp. LPB2021202275-12-8 TaxID=3120159 RepID=UPI00300D4D86
MPVPRTSSVGAALPAVAVVDTEGTVIGWTESAEELLGYRPDDVLDRSGELLLMPDDAAERIAAWAERFGDRTHWSGLVELRHRDGGRLMAQIEGSRLVTSGGRAAWFLSVTRSGVEAPGRSVPEAALVPLFSRLPVALGIWDRDLRCVWMNETAELNQEAFPHYRLGHRLGEPLPGSDTEAWEGAMRRVLSDGCPVVDRECRWISADRREERTYSTSFFRLDGVAGLPLGVCSLTLDISRSRARDRLAMLGEASTRIGSTLDVQKTAQELADLAVPRLADYVTIDLAESVLPNEEPLQRLPSTEVSIPVFRRAGLASIHPGTPESLWPYGEAVFVPPASPFTEVLSSGRSHYEPALDVSSGSWLDQDPDRATVIRDTGMHSLIIVPLQARGDILGVAVFVRTENPAPFTGDDLVLAEELVARAALSLDNARQYTRERFAALALQRNLLPSNVTGGGAVELATRYVPSDVHDSVGGDWFDAIPLPGGRVALVVGDVIGHGINAAAAMGRLRTAVFTLAHMDLPPDELLTRLDDLVVRLTESTSIDGFPLEVMVATCVYAVYDPATGLCTMAGAGHPPPAIVDPAGDVRFPDLPSGTPIGLGLGFFESLELELAEGTMIALYTDGLIETREADIDEGMNRLGAALVRAAGPLEDLCTKVIDAMVGETPSEDDIALLIARTRRSD